MNQWWSQDVGKGRDLRELLYELLSQCLDIKPFSPINRLGERIESTSFKNVFREKNKTIDVLTPAVIADFICLCKQKDIGIRNNYALRKAIDMIGDSFNIAIPDDININNHDTYINCNTIRECWNGMGVEWGFENKCNNCPAQWLYKKLRFIEKNYNLIVNAPFVSKRYKNKEEQKLVYDIYESIKECEKNNSSDSKMNLSEIGDLWVRCMNCLPHMQDVADEKMAYVKWYTARLSSWPLLRASLKDMYNEMINFELLDSASMILYELGHDKDDLWVNVETDRITSYMTLARENPYFIYSLSKHANHEDYIISNINNTSLFNQLSLYITLWQLNIESKSATSGEYERLIERLSNRNELNNHILNFKYQILKYLYGYASFSDTLNTIQCLDDKTDGLTGNNDTIFTLSSLFMYKIKDDIKANRIILNMEFYNINLKNLSKMQPDVPSCYQRIFGDVMLVSQNLLVDIQRYEDRLNQYVCWLHR